MILYLDTSALLKRYVVESYSMQVAQLIEEAEVVGSSLLTSVEVATGLAKAARLNWLPRPDAEAAWADFLVDWGFFSRLILTPSVLERAGRYGWGYNLRAYDALHLAAAVTWQENLGIPVTLATFDRHLWLAAPQAGLVPWPPGLY